jgi:hypothetical protein
VFATLLTGHKVVVKSDKTSTKNKLNNSDQPSDLNKNNFNNELTKIKILLIIFTYQTVTTNVSFGGTQAVSVVSWPLYGH